MLTIFKNRSLMDDFFNDSFFNDNLTYNNNYRFYKTDDGYSLDMLVPGFNKENLSVELDDNKIFIKGETKYEDNTLMSELCNSFISKKFIIPHDVDTSKIDADVTDGVLSIKLPFTKKSKKKVIKLV